MQRRSTIISVDHKIKQGAPRPAFSMKGDTMKYLFVPDIFKYEEEFIIEGDCIEDTVKQAQEECPINCIFAVYKLGLFGLLYLGLLRLEEGKPPEWIIDSQLQLHDEGR